MFNIFKDTIAKDLSKIADYFNGVADAGTIFKDKRALAVNRIKNAVLNGDIGGGGGVTPEIEAEIENAQWKTESTEQLFSETVTAEDAEFEGFANLTYTDFISTDTLTVIFDGVEYICTKQTDENGNSFYGATYDGETRDYSEYPFQLSSFQDDGSGSPANVLYTKTVGHHTISVSTKSTTYTDAFKEGVAKNSTFYVDFDTTLDTGITANKTFDEIVSAYNNGAVVLGRFNARIYNITRVVIAHGSIQGIGFSYVEYVPDDEKVDVKLIRANNEGFTYYATSISTAVVTP